MSIRIRFLAVILLIVMILSVTLFPFQQQVSAARTPQVSKISGQIALFTDGTVWVWGSDPYGSDGSSFEPEGLRIPVQIKELADVIDIARGGGFSVALKKTVPSGCGGAANLEDWETGEICSPRI